MSRIRSVFRCESCDAEEPKWAGRCGTCGEWNSLVERVSHAPRVGGGPDVSGCEAQPLAITDVLVDGSKAVPTGLAELDRVLGGGLLPGSATLLGGEPGVGKSTLVLQYPCGTGARRRELRLRDRRGVGSPGRVAGPSP
ncbi:MAG: hypothetical protein M5U19_01740 [Microthrixaceae bacterium]|nr:hypothetical protein [Microthrixaceae bacterium]